MGLFYPILPLSLAHLPCRKSSQFWCWSVCVGAAWQGPPEVLCLLRMKEACSMESERSQGSGCEPCRGPGMQQQAVVETQSAHSLSPRAVATPRGIPQQPGVKGSQFSGDSSMPCGMASWGVVRLRQTLPPGLSHRTCSLGPYPGNSACTTLNTLAAFSP